MKKILYLGSMDENLYHIYQDLLNIKDNLTKDNLNRVINHSDMINTFLLDEFERYFKKEDIAYLLKSTNKGLSINDIKKYKIDYSKNIIFNKNEEYDLIMPKALASIFRSEEYTKEDNELWELFFYENNRFIGLNVFLINN